MARLFWIALGAAAGVAHGLSDFGEGLRELADAIREGMAEREDELRLALGIDTGTAEDVEAGRLDPEAARQLLEDPTGRFDSRAR